jgi:predicted HTH domain antitoxin
MGDVEANVELLRKAGGYEDDAAVLEDAFRTLLRTKPALRTELAVETYRTERVSLNRAAEIAGMSPTEFRELLHDRGISRPASFLSDEDRDEQLGES